MAILHLLKNFNNYYNRQLKIRETLEDYIDDDEIYITSIGTDERPMNFDIKDGLLTEAIFNYTAANPTPDYAIVEFEDTFTRWFVIECKQTRGLQHKAILKRDVLAEFYSVIKESPCIIQKGYVGNSSVLAFNKEQQQYNKVKDKELLIKDNTNMGYVVGFIDRDAEHSGPVDATYKGSLQINFDYASLPTSIKDYMAIGSATPNETLERIKGDSTNNICPSLEFGLKTIRSKLWYYGKVFSKPRSNFPSTPSTGEEVTNYTTLDRDSYNVYPVTYTNCYAVSENYVNITEAADFMGTYASMWRNKLINITKDMWYSYLGLDLTTLTILQQLNGKICEIGGVYYKCKLVSGLSVQNKSMGVNASPYAAALTNALKVTLPSETELNGIVLKQRSVYYDEDHTPFDTESTDYTIYYNTEEIYLRLVPQNVNVWTELTAKSSRSHLIDAPYDMFVIPYGDDSLDYTYMNVTYHPDKNMAVNLAIEMCRSLGTSESYDIQIVPYCPIRNEGTIGDTIDFSLCNCELIYNGTNHDATDTVVGVYMWAEKSSDTFSIVESRSDLTLVGSELTYKEITQLKQFILCSPDKAAQWEFNPCMNNGIKKWNVSFDYRPFSSYVKIQPEWDYLYGTAESDMRGLIFNGAYSITQLSDAWNNYVANNKNYQAIFDTQIGSQIKQYDIQNKAAWDTLTARSIGWGFVGPAMKTYYNIKEQEMQESIQNVQLEAQRKLFEYQLDNIQSQPTTISKLTSINTDFRIFPFVEIFTGSDTDIKNFRNNIKWNGMTIMCVGMIEEYLESGTETFIQATLLRYNHFIEIENDFTAVQEINTELNKGIYITKEV